MSITNIHALVLLSICILIEVYHIIFYKWTAMNIGVIRAAITRYNNNDPYINDDNLPLQEQYGLNDRIIRQFVSTMAINTVYWIILVGLIFILTNWVGFGLFIIMVVMSAAVASIQKVYELSGAWRKRELVTLIDAIVSIIIYAVLIIMCCFH